MNHDGQLHERLRHLEDIEAINRLKTLYCFHCDDGFDADAIAKLFAQDGVWDGGSLRGVQSGRDAIRAYFAQNHARIPFSVHLLANRLIEVDADRARGRWRMLMPYNTIEDTPHGARWQVSAYDDDFVRVGGRWLFQTVRVKLARLDAGRGEWVEI